MSWSSKRDLDVVAMASKMVDGEQRSGELCPFCNSTDRSFNIKKEGDCIFYNCKRASCHISGMTRTGIKLVNEVRAQGKSRYATWLREVSPLVVSDKDWMWNNWKFQDKHMRKGCIERVRSTGRLVLPIFNATGKEVGATLRSMQVAQVPKSVICMTDNDSLCLSFYKGEMNTDVMIVVEDQASALRASYYCGAVALLGTNMDICKARAISRTDCKKVIFCLDKDAFSKSIEMSSKYGSMFDQYSTHCPPKDLKNMTEAELVVFLSTVCNLSLEKKE